MDRNKKSIIYIGGFELPDKNAAAHRVLNNAKALRELGYDVIFIDINRECSTGILETKDECCGFTKFSMQYTNKRLVSIEDFQKVYKFLNIDLYAVIAYNYPGIALGKLLGFCRKNKIKIYADCTEWFGFLGNNPITKLIKGIDSFIRMNIVQPKLDGMIAISSYIASYYEKKLPTICIPPLTDINDEKWKPEPAADHEFIEILYAGNPGKHKDKINKIIEALTKMPDAEVHLTVIGISKEEFLSYYPEDKNVLEQLEDMVTFKGKLPHREVITYLKQADFSMFYREVTRITMAGFPTKFSEAITCGTPVITNKTSDLERYLIEGENGYWINDIESDLRRLFVEKKTICCKDTVSRSLFYYESYKNHFKRILK